MSINSGTNPALTQGSGVGGKTWLPQVTVPTTTGAYSAGNSIGGVLVFPNALAGYSGALPDIVITDKTGQAGAMTVYLFKSAPVTTFTDRSAVTFNDTDAVEAIGSFSIAAGTDGWITAGGWSQATVACSGKAIASSNMTTLWVAILAAGAVTFGEANALIATLGIFQD